MNRARTCILVRVGTAVAVALGTAVALGMIDAVMLGVTRCAILVGEVRQAPVAGVALAQLATVE